MTDDRPTPHLTKSNYLAGLQCSLRLWKQLHAPRPFVEASPGTPQYEGRRIGELARKCFPGGELVQNPTSDHEGASAQTKRLMMSDCPAIFEGAFEHGNRRVRVDVLKRIGIEKWALYEVKSSTSARNEHCDDAAFQADVLSKSGVALDSITIVHVDSSYRRKPGDIDPTQFFRFVDVTARLSAHFDALGLNLPRMIATLNSEQGPQVPPGPHCWSPRECEFLAQCTESLPRDWIGHLPRISRDQFAEMAAAGVMSIAEIPEQFHLSEVQETGEPLFVDGRQNGYRHRPPPLHHRRDGPPHRARARADRRDGNPPGIARPRRSLREPVAAAVGRVPARGRRVGIRPSTGLRRAGSSGADPWHLSVACRRRPARIRALRMPENSAKGAATVRSLEFSYSLAGFRSFTPGVCFAPGQAIVNKRLAA